MKYFIAGMLLFTNGLFAQQAVKVNLAEHAAHPVISKNIYGHFSEHLGRCIYDGFWVDDSLQVPKKDRIRLDVVEALKKIKIPVLRWPGGCYADQYHWKDAIGTIADRKKTVNTIWGMVTDDNSFGTHEFLNLCGLLNCAPYIAGNVGTGTPEEMENWIEYLNFNGASTLTKIRQQNGRATPWNVSFWGVGNESWGCGGFMTPEYYAQLYRRYSEFCKNYPGAPLKLIASGANSEDYNWTEVVMKNIPLWRTWGISLHYYTFAGSWENKGKATGFGEAEYIHALKNCIHTEDVLNRHEAIMDKYDPEKKVALVVDEWGIWTDAEPGTNPAFLYQQNSFRDALIAATSLNIFNNHSTRVRMANLAQTINVLQALILTRKNEMLLTPTYHVFDLYKVHQDAVLIPLDFKSPLYINGRDTINAVNISASKDTAGAIHISLVNLDPKQIYPLNLAAIGTTGKTVTAQILHAASYTTINTFEQPDKVKITGFTGFKTGKDGLQVNLPALSIVVLEIK